MAGDPGERFSMVLTNPPFGKPFAKRSSITIVNGETGELQKEEMTYERQDLLAMGRARRTSS